MYSDLHFIKISSCSNTGKQFDYETPGMSQEGGRKWP